MASELEQRLGYTFRNRKLLEHALTHSSYANENRKDGLTSNERLEFLGDSVLGFVVASYLFETYPERPEGELTKLRAALVCEKSLAAAAAKLNLGAALLLGHGEEHGGGRKSSSITADAMESVLAAAYLDGGLEAASRHHPPPDFKRRDSRSAGSGLQDTAAGTGTAGEKSTAQLSAHRRKRTGSRQTLFRCSASQRQGGRLW